MGEFLKQYEFLRLSFDMEALPGCQKSSLQFENVEEGQTETELFGLYAQCHGLWKTNAACLHKTVSAAGASMISQT